MTLMEEHYEYWRARCEQVEAGLKNVESALEDMEARKDNAYKERDMVLALAASAINALSHQRVVFAWLGRHQEDDPAWDNDWRNVVYIQLPTGQLSWHIHDSELPWFSFLEKGPLAWDGHTTEEKYKRLLDFVQDV